MGTAELVRVTGSVIRPAVRRRAHLNTVSPDHPFSGAASFSAFAKSCALILAPRVKTAAI